MGLKDSLIFLSEFNEIKRNPKFRSKTDLMEPDSPPAEVPPNFKKGRRSSLNITVGTPETSKETVRQRTFTVPNPPINNSDTMSMKISQKDLNKNVGEEDLIKKNIQRGRRSSEPVNIGLLKKRTGLFDGFKKKNLNVILTASDNNSSDSSGENTPTRKQFIENSNNLAECSTSSDDDHSTNKDTSLNLPEMAIHEDWEAERVASGLEVIVKIGGDTKNKVFQQKTT